MIDSDHDVHGACPPHAGNQAFMASPYAQAVLDPAWRVILPNALWDLRIGSAGTVTWFDVVHPDDLTRDFASIARVQSGESSEFRESCRVRMANQAHAHEGGNESVKEHEIQYSAVELVVTQLGGGLPGFLATLIPHLATPPRSSRSTDDGRQLATALSHDVRQHARLAATYCSLLERDPLDQRQRKLLAVVSDHAERLLQQLERLVQWLRLADEPMARTSCSLTDIWRGITGELALHCNAVVLPNIPGDAAMLTLMLREIALNAVHYHPGTAHLTVGMVRHQDMWTLTITDDGTGIPAEHRERMLLPTHRLHRWEEVPGHGMGLALAARVAARHGGDLRLDESPTGGCMVQVRLCA